MNEPRQKKPLWQYANQTRFNVALAIGFALAMFLPYLVRGKDASLLVNDNLEQLERFGPIRDGAPLQDSWQLTHLLAHHFGVFWGLVANEMLVRGVAFAGMWLLVRRLTRVLDPPVMLWTLSACSFASLPLWPQGDLAVAGIPMALVALVNLRDRRQLGLSCLMLSVFAYHSHPSLSGIPLMLLTGGWLVLERVRRRPQPFVLLGVAVLALVYIVTRGALFEPSAVSNVVSTAHLRPGAGASWSEWIGRTSRFFVESAYFAQTNHETVILTSGVACAGFLVGRKSWTTRGAIYFVVGYALLASTWFVLQLSPLMTGAPDIVRNLLDKVRWYFLLPCLWYVAWSMLLADTIASAVHRPRAVGVALALLTLQILTNASDSAVRTMFATPTFSQFVSTDLFSAIKQQLALKPGERVGCVAFHPAAARYNEIPTLDSNIAEGAKQKLAVRRIIATALERKSTIRDRFERPGAPMYLLDDELSRVIEQRQLHKRRNEITPDFDNQALQEYRVKYLLSALPFRKAKELGYRLIYEKKSDYYRMFVYQVY